MKEIKFRGQILHGPRKGEWVYGYYANILGDHLIIDNSGIQYIVDPNTVGIYAKRYCGLGVYIGDIFECEYGEQENNEKTIIKGVVRYDEGVLYFDCWAKIFTLSDLSGEVTKLYWRDHSRWNGDMYYVIENIKIIGNIHDNPDLLTQ